MPFRHFELRNSHKRWAADSRPWIQINLFHSNAALMSTALWRKNHGPSQSSFKSKQAWTQPKAGNVFNHYVSAEFFRIIYRDLKVKGVLIFAPTGPWIFDIEVEEWRKWKSSESEIVLKTAEWVMKRITRKKNVMLTFSLTMEKSIFCAQNIFFPQWMAFAAISFQYYDFVFIHVTKHTTSTTDIDIFVNSLLLMQYFYTSLILYEKMQT